MKNTKALYRGDIDGLRAIAIISVLLFHLNSKFLPGGFVGVDVFFVISGFLITQIILKETENNNFSFALFYIRRIRRILPTLFVVLFTCLAMATMMLTEESFEWFGKTLKYAALQISNILFQRQAGYFDPSFEGMPLLHTWSLGIEEQFYLVWPIALLLLLKIKKYKNSPFYALLIISGISLALSQYLLNSGQQKVAFFLLPSRMWELGLGGMLAFGKIKQPKKEILNELFALLGLALIAISVFITKKDSFPGFAALLPCVGTGLVILSGCNNKTTVSTKALSSGVFVFIGSISYSLYLWHWPIIIFYKEYSSTAELSLLASLAISLITILISYLSWKFIENPFRAKKSLEDEIAIRVKIKKITIALYRPIIIAAIFISLFAWISHNIAKTKWQWRMSKQGDASIATLNSIAKADCLEEWENRYLTYNKCTVGGNKENPEVLLFGDSHAEHYSTAVIDWAKKNQLTVLLLSSSGCPPIFDIQIESRPSCQNAQKRIREEFARKANNIKYVFMAGRWSLYVNESIPQFLLNDLGSKDKKSSLKKAERVFRANIEKTLKELNGKTIVLLGEVPSSKDNRFVEQAEKKSRLFLYKKFPNYYESKIPNVCTAKNHESKVLYTRDILKKMANANSNVRFFDPAKYLCKDDSCFYQSDDGLLLYKDENHLNVNGGHYIGKYFNPSQQHH